MLFDNKLETINDMIEFSIELIDSNVEFDFYVNEMIKKFFPEANIDIVKKMCEWAKYPTLCMITLNELRKIEINERTTEFKKTVAHNIVSQDQYNTFQNMISYIRGAQTLGYYMNSRIIEWNNANNEFGSWNNIVISIQNNGIGFGPNQHNQSMYAENIIYHIKFTETIRSIWKSKNNKFEQSIETLTITNNELNKQVQSLTIQIKNLEDRNQLLQDQITSDARKINLIQSKLDAIERKYTPELIEYNYEEISARLDPIRSELKMTQRIFARIIRNHYDVPLAVVVNKN